MVKQAKPKLVPLPRCFEVLGCGKTKGFQLVRDGVIKTVRLGKRRYATAESIDHLVTEGQQAA
jgi:hypothetical protein